jgi:hypothetical protein
MDQMVVKTPLVAVIAASATTGIGPLRRQTPTRVTWFPNTKVDGPTLTFDRRLVL